MPLNFYQLYNLLNENTVSQELKRLKKEKPEFDELLKASYVSINQILPNISEKSSRIIANWVLFGFFKYFEAANMQKFLQNNDIVMAFNTYLRNILLLNTHRNYLSSQLDNHGNWSALLASKFNDPNFSSLNLTFLDGEYHENLKKRQRNMPGREGETILSFPDGYKWVDLERGDCDMEAKAMGHCGNAGALKGDTILSLRDDKNIPHLTFILNEGMLVERKARNNSKPLPKYHNYIIELLKLPIIKGLGAGRYAPENDFKLSDLKEEEIFLLFKINPGLKVGYYKEKLNSDESILQELPKEDLILLANSNDLDILNILSQSYHTPGYVLDAIYNSHPHGGSFESIMLQIMRNPNASRKTSKEIEELYASDDHYSNEYH